MVQQQSKSYHTYEYTEGKISITISRKSQFPENTILNSNSKNEDNLMFEEKKEDHKDPVKAYHLRDWFI